MANGSAMICGRSLSASAFVTLIFVTSSVLAAQATRGVVETSSDGQLFEVECTATFSADALVFGKLLGYDTVTLAEGECLDEPGRPMLPAKQLRIALPTGMGVTGVRVVDTTVTPIAGEYSVFPAQPPRRVSDSAEVNLVGPDPATYALTQEYPSKLAEFTYQTDLAGQAIAVVRLYPVRYVPAERWLSLCTSITFVLEGVEGYECGDYMPDRISATARTGYERMVKGMVLNPADVALRPLDHPAPQTAGVAPGEYDYVIITKADWHVGFQRLADWKSKKGVPATVVEHDWIYDQYSGATNQEKIRAFVRDAHDNWGAVYFLLGGDTNTIPNHTRNLLDVDIPNDTYYADYDDDWTCEVHVGRAPVRDYGQIVNFVSKVLTYETEPPPSSYAKRAAFFGFDLNTYGSREGQLCKMYIKANYIPDDWTYRREYDSEEGSHRADVIGYLNQGSHLLNHIDHCNQDVMGVGCVNHDEYLFKSDMSDLSNGYRQGILYSIGCWPCAYDFNTCIAEAFVRNPDGGGVAFIGNSRYGYYQAYSGDFHSLRYDRYFFRSLLGQDHYRLGECFSDHKNDAYQSGGVYPFVFTELTLLGDPELPVWTDDPAILTVTHDDTVEFDGWPFLVHVEDDSGPVDNATASLWKSADLQLSSQTNSTGYAYFFPYPDTPGTVHVTVTKRNYRPYLGCAEVIPPEYTLTVDLDGGTMVTKIPDQATYTAGETVLLFAYGDGWTFDHWSGDLTGSDNPANIHMDGDKTVLAHFTPDCPEDLDGDGLRGLSDLAELLAAYGATVGDDNWNPYADLDGSGAVGLGDLAQLLGVYGAPCP